MPPKRNSNNHKSEQPTPTRKIVLTKKKALEIIEEDKLETLRFWLEASAVNETDINSFLEIYTTFPPALHALIAQITSTMYGLPASTTSGICWCNAAVKIFINARITHPIIYSVIAQIYCNLNRTTYLAETKKEKNFIELSFYNQNYSCIVDLVSLLIPNKTIYINEPWLQRVFDWLSKFKDLKVLQGDIAEARDIFLSIDCILDKIVCRPEDVSALNPLVKFLLHSDLEFFLIRSRAPAYDSCLKNLIIKGYMLDSMPRNNRQILFSYLNANELVAVYCAIVHAHPERLSEYERLALYNDLLGVINSVEMLLISLLGWQLVVEQAALVSAGLENTPQLPVMQVETSYVKEIYQILRDIIPARFLTNTAKSARINDTKYHVLLAWYAMLAVKGAQLGNLETVLPQAKLIENFFGVDELFLHFAANDLPIVVNLIERNRVNAEDHAVVVPSFVAQTFFNQTPMENVDVVAIPPDSIYMLAYQEAVTVMPEMSYQVRGKDKPKRQALLDAFEVFTVGLETFDANYMAVMRAGEKYQINFQKWLVFLYYEANTGAITWILENASTYDYSDDDMVMLYNELLTLIIDDSRSQSPFVTEAERGELIGGALDLLSDLQGQDENISAIQPEMDAPATSELKQKKLPKARASQIIANYRKLLLDEDALAVIPYISKCSILFNMTQEMCAFFHERIKLITDKKEHQPILREIVKFLREEEKSTRKAAFKAVNLLPKAIDKKGLIWVIARHNQSDIDVAKKDFSRESQCGNQDFIIMLMKSNLLNDLVEWLNIGTNSLEINVEAIGLPPIISFINHLVTQKLFELLYYVLAHLEKLGLTNDLCWDSFKLNIDVNKLFMRRFMVLFVYQKKRELNADPLLAFLHSDSSFDKAKVFEFALEEGNESLLVEMIRHLGISKEMLLELYADIGETFGVAGLKRVYNKLVTEVKNAPEVHQQFLRTYLVEDVAAANTLLTSIQSITELNLNTCSLLVRHHRTDFLVAFIKRIGTGNELNKPEFGAFLDRFIKRLVVEHEASSSNKEHHEFMSFLLDLENSSFFLSYLSYFPDKVDVALLSQKQLRRLVIHLTVGLENNTQVKSVEALYRHNSHVLLTDAAFYKAYRAYRIKEFAKRLQNFNDSLRGDAEKELPTQFREFISEWTTFSAWREGYDQSHALNEEQSTVDAQDFLAQYKAIKMRFLQHYVGSDHALTELLLPEISALSQLDARARNNFVTKHDVSSVIAFASRMAENNDCAGSEWIDFCAKFEARIAKLPSLTEAMHLTIRLLYLQQNDSSFFLDYFSKYSEKLVISSLSIQQREQLLRHVPYALANGKYLQKIEELCQREPGLFLATYINHKVRVLAAQLARANAALATQNEVVIDPLIRRQIAVAGENFAAVFTYPVRDDGTKVIKRDGSLAEQMQHYRTSWNQFLVYVRRNGTAVIKACPDLVQKEKRDTDNTILNRIQNALLWDIVSFFQSHPGVQKLLDGLKADSSAQQAVDDTKVNSSLQQVTPSLIGKNALIIFLQTIFNQTVLNDTAVDLRLLFSGAVPLEALIAIQNKLKVLVDECFPDTALVIENESQGQNRRFKYKIMQGDKLLVSLFLTDDYVPQYWTNSCVFIDLQVTETDRSYQMKPCHATDKVDPFISILNREIELPVLNWHEPLIKAGNYKTIIASWAFLFGRINYLSQSGFALNNAAQAKWLECLRNGSQEFWKSVIQIYQTTHNINLDDLYRALPGLKEKVTTPAVVTTPVMLSKPPAVNGAASVRVNGASAEKGVASFSSPTSSIGAVQKGAGYHNGKRK